jgi:D-3-phosphoglycerate dehydrogenase
MKILLSPSSIGQISSAPLDLLTSNGYEITINPYGRKLTSNEVVSLASDCIGIVAGLEPLDKTVLNQLPKLKCISRVGVGMDNIDIDYAQKKGIKIVNTPNGPTRAVAELTLGLTMSLLRKIPFANNDLKNRNWKKYTGNLLFNKKIGVLGLGRIGKNVSELFLALGNEVCGFDINPDFEWAKKKNFYLKDFNEILSTCDIITVHIPGSNNSTPFISKKELSLMKKDSILINVSRGGVVDETELFNFLKENKILGAAVDVFNEEPYYGPLCDLENIILTPHMGSYAKEGKLQMEIDAVKNLISSLD